MFDEKKRPAKAGPLKRGGTPRQVSEGVIASCYVASALIAVISILEAVRSFGAGNDPTGALYAAAAVLGVLFSVFITVLNNRNRRLLGQKGKNRTRKSERRR